MEKRTKSLCGIVFALVWMFAGCAPAHAASDLTGTWTTIVKTPEGLSIPVNVSFRQMGSKLTGTVAAPVAEPVSIENGKVEGNKLSFTLSVNGMTIVNQGTISGGEIRMVSTPPSNAELPEYDLTLKRSK
jgi:hypothetical protein